MHEEIFSTQTDLPDKAVVNNRAEGTELELELGAGGELPPGNPCETSGVAHHFEDGYRVLRRK
jgi:hypothetical protein